MQRNPRPLKSQGVQHMGRDFLLYSQHTQWHIKFLSLPEILIGSGYNVQSTFNQCSLFTCHGRIDKSSKGLCKTYRPITSILKCISAV